jgi:hypothetical protein
MDTSSPGRRSLRHGTRRSGDAARQAADSPVMAALARAGLVARGINYLLLGVIAIEIATDNSGQQADRTGELRLVGQNPFGEVVLWLLVIGFAGMALWQLSQAIWGSPGPDGKKASKRLAAAARTVFYAVVTFGILKYAIGLGAPASSDKQSQDLTATVMHYPGGQVLIVIIGLVFIGGGGYLAFRAWQKKFLKRLRLEGTSPAVRRAVELLGQAGGIARGVVFATAGVFLVVAGVQGNPDKAKGLDSALRALDRTPLGPWLLGVVALGLVLFGVYSGCEARWREV